MYSTERGEVILAGMSFPGKGGGFLVYAVFCYWKIQRRGHLMTDDCSGFSVICRSAVH